MHLVEHENKEAYWNTIRLNSELKDALDNIRQLQEDMAYLQTEIKELKGKHD